MSVLNSQPEVYRGEPGLARTSKPSALGDFPPRLSQVLAGSDSEPRIFSVPLTHRTRGTFSAGPTFLVGFQRLFLPEQSNDGILFM